MKYRVVNKMSVNLINFEPSSVSFAASAKPYKNNLGKVLNSFSQIRVRVGKCSQFGISDYKGSKKYSLSLEIAESEAEILRQFEALALDHVVKNRDALVGLNKSNKSKSKEMVEDAFRSPLKKNTDGRFFLNVKVKTSKDGKWNVKLFDENKDMIYPNEESDAGPLELVEKFAKVSSVLQFEGVWFTGGKFGVSWRLVQAMVFPVEQREEDTDDECWFEEPAGKKSRVDSFQEDL